MCHGALIRGLMAYAGGLYILLLRQSSWGVWVEFFVTSYTPDTAGEFWQEHAALWSSLEKLRQCGEIPSWLRTAQCLWPHVRFRPKRERLIVSWRLLLSDSKWIPEGQSQRSRCPQL